MRKSRAQLRPFGKTELSSYFPNILRSKTGQTPKNAFKLQFNKHFMDLTFACLATSLMRTAQAGFLSLRGQKRVEVGTVAATLVCDDTRDAWFEIYDWAYESHTRGPDPRSDRGIEVRNLKPEVITPIIPMIKLDKLKGIGNHFE